MTLSLSLIDFALFALALQGFIITGLLFYSSKTIVSNRWLGALVFIVSDAILVIQLDHMGIWTRYLELPLLIPHFSFALGPVVYCYTKSLIDAPQATARTKWLHFLPVVIDLKTQLIFLIYTSGLLYLPFLQDLFFKPLTQNILFDSVPFTAVLRLCSVAGYAIVTYIIIIRHQRKGDLSANKSKDLKWLKVILRTLFVFIMLWFGTVKIPALQPWGQYTVLLPLIAAVYILGMAAWRRQSQMSIAEKEEYTQKPAKLYFMQYNADVYTRRLHELMTKQQLYLNPVLKVDDVAAQLSISEKALSSLINQHLGKNFNDYVNEYRIEEVKLRLADPRNHSFTIAAIAFDCGFNSLATFQRVFKQFTGTTPSKFQSGCFGAISS